MLKMEVASATDRMNLNQQQERGWGWQAHAGVTGMGLPPVQGQWLEGAGDGAVHRGTRVLSRDLDLPLSFLSNPETPVLRQRDELIKAVGRMARMMSGEMKLTAIDTDGVSWYILAHRVGGGNYVYGHDTTGENSLEMVVTVRAGDPFWTAVVPKVSEVIQQSSASGLLTAKPITNLRLAASQAIGEIRLDNSDGDADAFPIWHVTGPGNTFRAVSPTGENFQWNGTLTAGQTLTVDCRTGEVRDGTGANRYSDMAPAPRFWAITPGTATVTASIVAPGPTTRIAAQWRPRKWAVL